MTAQDELLILDGIRMAHDIRWMLWQEWGERAVPRLSVLQDRCELTVRGSDGTYVVTIRKEQA